MKIHLHEITDLETELDFTQEEGWVVSAVEAVDETTEDSAREKLNPHRVAPKRDISAHFSLRKVDEVVVVEGKIHTKIHLLCSRCANSFELAVEPKISGLFCKDPVMAGVAHLVGKGKPAGQTKGFARHAHDEVSSDLDITYLSEDYVDLQAVLIEQLQLQVPFQPLCREECKGICSNCGTDLNSGRCACAKVAKTNPFAVLKEFTKDATKCQT